MCPVTTCRQEVAPAADIPPPPTTVKTPSAPLIHRQQRHLTRDGHRADPTTAQPARGKTAPEATKRTSTAAPAPKHVASEAAAGGVDGSERHLETKRVSRRVDGETSQFTV